MANNMELTVDEVTGRGIEKIRDPVELSGLLHAIISATPDTVPKKNVLELFMHEWNYCRGDTVEEESVKEERCRHFRVNVILHRKYTDNGYDAEAHCADCGMEIDVVEVT